MFRRNSEGLAKCFYVYRNAKFFQSKLDRIINASLKTEQEHKFL